MRPHIFRTHDGGKTWTQITSGIPDGAIVNVVREDPKRRGLLFAGSRDAGMGVVRRRRPLVVAPAQHAGDVDSRSRAQGRRHRRGHAWPVVLDSRRHRAAARRSPRQRRRLGAHALQAGDGVSASGGSKYPDTPIPPDEPCARRIRPTARSSTTTSAPAPAATRRSRFVDASDRVIRKYSSRDTSMAPADLGNTPSYWIRPTKVLSAAPGFHRFVWDLHYAPPAGTSAQPGQYPISAIPFDTPREPRGPLAIAGSYTVRLTVGDKTQTQPLTLKMDPRVKTPPAVLARQHALAVTLWDAIARDSATVVADPRPPREHCATYAAAPTRRSRKRLSTYDAKLGALAGQAGGGRGAAGGGTGGGRGGRGAAAQPSIASTNAGQLSRAVSAR